ncbi:MAG: TRAP transporter large permease subunit [Treponema sp.]|jgi:tripartite ATP-independent transporter DctM subunit|nr:TRAP transporter large permease subunit [Treponema sp.]
MTGAGVPILPGAQDSSGGAGTGEKIHRILYLVENGLCIIVLVFLSLLPALDAGVRIFLNTGVPGSSGLLIHLLLLAGMLAGMIATRKEEHLSIALVQYFSEDRLKKNLRCFSNLLSAFVVCAVAWCGPAFIKIGLSGELAGFIPDRVFALIIPAGYGIIALRFARRTGLGGWKRIFPVLALLLGTAVSFPSIAKFIWDYNLPPWAADISAFLQGLAEIGKVPAVILLLAAALAGTPLFVVMGGLVLILLEAAAIPVDVMATDIYSALTNDSIIAIPLFTLVGFFLSESRAGSRLVDAFRSLFSWLPGGIIIATVIICAFFTSFTGASGVTILALGGILFTILSEHVKYPEKFSIGLLTSVGSVGLLFPPSLPLILVGAMTETNPFHMLAGGIIPGIILVAAVIVFGIVISVRTKIPVERFETKKALRALKDSALEIILPFFLITGYFTGFLTLVEIGAAAVIYIFIAEVLIHRDIAFRDVPQVFLKAVPIIGGVLAILALSQSLSYYIVDTNIPATLADWMQQSIRSKHLFLILLNLALLVVGCLMDIFSAILIVLPLLVPLAEAYGVDPVHLGIIFITNLEVGFLTPPVGLNLFLASYRFKKPFVDICRFVFPFLIIQLVVVLLVTYVPWLSMYLTRFF